MIIRLEDPRVFRDNVPSSIRDGDHFPENARILAWSATAARIVALGAAAARIVGWSVATAQLAAWRQRSGPRRASDMKGVKTYA